MPYGFLNIATTPSVGTAQGAIDAGDLWRDFKGHRAFDRFTESEAAFIAARACCGSGSTRSTGTARSVSPPASPRRRLPRRSARCAGVSRV